MGSRNRLIHLLELYEILLDGPQSFHSLRNKLGMGYKSLQNLLSKLIDGDFLQVEENENVKYYIPSKKLIILFKESFYDGLREFSQ